MTTQDFAKLFGGLIAVFVAMTIPLHLISFTAGTWFFDSYYADQVAKFGLQDVWWGYGAAKVATFLSSGTLEVLHYFVPPLFFWMLFTLTTWWKSPKTWVMFLAIGAIGYGLTQASAFTSREGAVSIARSQYKAPAPIDVSADESAYSTDSLRAENLSVQQLAAVDLDFDAKVAAAIAPYNAEIGGYNSALIGHRADLKKGNSWAPGWITKRNGQIRAAKANRESARHKAEAGRKAARAAVLMTKTKSMQSRSVDLLRVRASAATQDSTATANELATNAALVALADTGGGGVVWLIIVFGCVVTFYRVKSGHEYEGVEFKPSGRIGKAWSNTVGILTDKSDHMVDRLEVTRKHLKIRPNVRPFALPSGRFALFGIAAVGVVFFVVQTFIFTEAEQAEASFVPFPYNWGGLIMCVLGFALTYKKDASDRPGKSQGADNSATDADKKDDDDQGTEDIADNSDNESQGADNAENSLPDDLQGIKSEVGEDPAMESQQQVSDESAPPPPPGLAIPPIVSADLWIDEAIAYRKRVYGWWSTAHDKSRPEGTREDNRTKAESAFDWFRANGCKVTFKTPGKVGIKFPKK